MRDSEHHILTSGGFHANEGRSSKTSCDRSQKRVLYDCMINSQYCWLFDANVGELALSYLKEIRFRESVLVYLNI